MLVQIWVIACCLVAILAVVYALACDVFNYATIFSARYRQSSQMPFIPALLYGVGYVAAYLAGFRIPFWVLGVCVVFHVVAVVVRAFVIRNDGNGQSE